VVNAAFGTHNIRSIAHAMVCAEQLGVEQSRYEFQMLYGMSEPMASALVRMGRTMREYAPVGELIPGMGYLVRRLLENTSNEGFLRAEFAAHTSEAALLADPATVAKDEGGRMKDELDTPRQSSVSSFILHPSSFQNEP